MENCERHGVNFIEWPNDPLGAKHNAALNTAMENDADAFMILPSDDFVDALYVSAAMMEMTAGKKYIMPMSCGMYDSKTGRACILRHKALTGALSFGAGRIIHREVLDAVGNLWTPEKQRGLDTDSHARILQAGFMPHPIDLGPDVPCLTDVKTGENLWAYDRWAYRGKPAHPDKVLAMCDGEVIEAVRRASW